MSRPLEGRFRRQWLYVAVVVVALRMLNADGPGHDLGHQIAAAQKLLAGRGLSLYEHVGPELTEPSLVTLTHFPNV